MSNVSVSSGVLSGGTYYDTVSVFSSGSTSAITLIYGTEIVSDGGISHYTYLKRDATERVLQNGLSYDAHIDDTANLFVSSGGVAYASKIYEGGILSVESGGTSSNTLDVNAGEYVYRGGTAISTVVRGGDQQLFGGKSIGTILQGSSIQLIRSGGISSATNIAAGATQYVAGFGETAAMGDDIAYQTIDSGTENVYSAGKTSGTAIIGGGVEYVFSSGISYGTNVSSGMESVSSGGAAVGTKVFNGGTEIVSSGGVTSGTIIAGGEVEIEKGGKATGRITFSGGNGKLVIDTRAMPGATISGFGATDEIVLSAIPYSIRDSVSVNAPGIVTISAGGKDYNLHISGAAVGEMDFSFGSGSILTRGAPAQPAFLRPAESAPPAAKLLAQKLVITPPLAAQAAPPAGAMSASCAPFWHDTGNFGPRQETLGQVFSSRAG